MLIHPFEPVFDRECVILILGSFPSVKSRESGFYYGNPQNRFWRVLSAVYGEEVPSDTDGKVAFLLSNHIALWDAARSVDISGSADASIKNAGANDLGKIFNNSAVRTVYANGKTAGTLYERFCRPRYGFSATVLPSTSPANASFSLEKLVEAWRVIASPLNTK